MNVQETFTPESKLAQVIQAAWAEPNPDKAKQLVIDLIEPTRIHSRDSILQTLKGITNKQKFDYYLANSLLKFEKMGLKETPIKEGKLTSRDKLLIEMVNTAMAHPHDTDDLENNLSNDAAYDQAMDSMEDTTTGISEVEDLVQENPIPEYESIEELMKEIDRGTSKAALEYKLKRTKEIYEALETQLTSLEEGEHAKHIDKKHTRQMRRDIAALRRNESRLLREFDRKYPTKTRKKDVEKKTTEPVEELTISESRSRVLNMTQNKTQMTESRDSNFDLRSFLIENKLTLNSKRLVENQTPEANTIQWHDAIGHLKTTIEGYKIYELDTSGLDGIYYYVVDGPQGKQLFTYDSDEEDSHEITDIQNKLQVPVSVAKWISDDIQDANEWYDNQEDNIAKGNYIKPGQ